ncbi:T6SS immunity protein Tli3 family protein, partial [Pantoea sp. C2G6]|uniref:T6SS immunity protein Tli3 family protein n=1 Tax=Pantoea sp. C2G6 TaxID=3243084 RepID=UPI003EDB6903
MDKMILRAGGILGLLLTCGALSGCITTSGMAFGAASGGMAARGVGHDFKYYLFDVPPQVIYRIDDHRFFTLENYKDCAHGG